MNDANRSDDQFAAKFEALRERIKRLGADIVAARNADEISDEQDRRPINTRCSACSCAWSVNRRVGHFLTCKEIRQMVNYGDLTAQRLTKAP